MNSFFASCEQQAEPALRGRPVAVVPMDADSTSVIAASYEAKAFGIRTGTNVGLAKRLCSDLVIVPVRPGVYVDFHKRIVETVSTLLPSPRVLSVDEMACRLWPGNESSDAAAVRIGRQVKAAIRERVGEWLFCSVGIAPNVFLAKVASDLQKPNGLVLLRGSDLPDALLPLELRDLPGIGKNMHARLATKGINTIADLYAASAAQLRDAWGGVVGERWWYMIRGSQEADYQAMTDPARHSVSHSHVLGPDMRSDDGAEQVLLRLTGKAVTRMRRKGFVATGLQLDVTLINTERSQNGERFQKRNWHVASTRHVPADDPLIASLRRLWNGRPELQGGWTYQKVGVALTGLSPKEDRTLPLYEADIRRSRLAEAMDAINAQLGSGSVELASVHAARDLAPERIAFAKITDDDRERVSDDWLPAFVPPA